MSKLQIVSCDCGCGATENETELFFGRTGWCTLKYLDNKSDNEQWEYHFKSFTCLNLWLIEKNEG